MNAAKKRGVAWFKATKREAGAKNLGDVLKSRLSEDVGRMLNELDWLRDRVGKAEASSTRAWKELAEFYFAVHRVECELRAKEKACAEASRAEQEKRKL